MVHKLKRGPRPSFTGDWEKKQRRLGKGLTVVRTDQCPYIMDGATTALDAAKRASSAITWPINPAEAVAAGQNGPAASVVPTALSVMRS